MVWEDEETDTEDMESEDPLKPKEGGTYRIIASRIPQEVLDKAYTAIDSERCCCGSSTLLLTRLTFKSYLLLTEDDKRFIAMLPRTFFAETPWLRSQLELEDVYCFAVHLEA